LFTKASVTTFSHSYHTINLTNRKPNLLVEKE
jgi:hypothetical protein